MDNPTHEHLKWRLHAADARARLEVAHSLVKEVLKDIGLVSQHAEDHAEAALKDLRRSIGSLDDAVGASERG